MLGEHVAKGERHLRPGCKFGGSIQSFRKVWQELAADLADRHDRLRYTMDAQFGEDDEVYVFFQSVRDINSSRISCSL